MKFARIFVLSQMILAWQVAMPSSVARAQEAAPQGEDGAAEALSPREAKRQARALEKEFQRLFREEQYDQAITVLEEIVRLDPQDLHVYNLALIHYHRGDKEKSMETFQRFLDTKPRDRGLVREAQRFVRILEHDVRNIQEARRQAQGMLADAARTVEEARV
jgi:tetratricopeptide (TPR) repeat protein